MVAGLQHAFRAKDLEALVRSAVAARLSGSGRPAAAEPGAAPAVPPDGVCFVSGARLLGGDAGSPAPVPEAAIVADAVRCGMDSRLAASRRPGMTLLGFH